MLFNKLTNRKRKLLSQKSFGAGTMLWVDPQSNACFIRAILNIIFF